MRVDEIKEPIDLMFFYDYKGNGIPVDVVKKYCMDWEIYSAPSLIEIKIVPSKAKAKAFYKDLVGTCKGISNHILWSTFGISGVLGLPTETLTEALMWGCCHYGLTQREFPDGGEPLWVVE